MASLRSTPQRRMIRCVPLRGPGCFAACNGTWALAVSFLALARDLAAILRLFLDGLHDLVPAEGTMASRAG